jgi:hypothetical protein
MINVVIVHDLHKEKAYVCVDVNKALKSDSKGVQLAIEMQDTIQMGKTIFEYSPQLARFIENNGRTWRSRLLNAWFDGNYPSTTSKNDIPYLQRLRNNVISVKL